MLCLRWSCSVLQLLWRQRLFWCKCGLSTFWRAVMCCVHIAHMTSICCDLFILLFPAPRFLMEWSGRGETRDGSLVQDWNTQGWAGCKGKARLDPAWSKWFDTLKYSHWTCVNESTKGNLYLKKLIYSLQHIDQYEANGLCVWLYSCLSGTFWYVKQDIGGVTLTERSRSTESCALPSLCTGSHPSWSRVP